MPPTPMRLLPVPVFALVLLAACQPAADWELDLRRKVTSPTEPEPAPAIDPITLEQLADGLFHQAGQPGPFTGIDVEPAEKSGGPDAADGTVVATPYKDGRIDGARTTYSAGGEVRELRVYANGVPQESTLFYPRSRGGGQKLHTKLNANDCGEGPFRRWYPSGQLSTEATLDENGKWHGDFKEFAENGKLDAHYRWAHGKLVEIVFETPAQKARREKEQPALKVEQPQ